MSRASTPTEHASPKTLTLVRGWRLPSTTWCHCGRLDNGPEFPDTGRKANLSPGWKLSLNPVNPAIRLFFTVRSLSGSCREQSDLWLWSVVNVSRLKMLRTWWLLVWTCLKHISKCHGIIMDYWNVHQRTLILMFCCSGYSIIWDIYVYDMYQSSRKTM